MQKPATLPEHLRDIWDELEPQFAPRIGALGLEAACSQAYRLRTARAQIDKDGHLVRDSRGNPAPHPALAVEKQASAELREWLKRYGQR